MTTDRKRFSPRKWLKKENRNLKLVMHMTCILVILGLAVVLSDVHMLMSTLPLFAQEGGDFIEGI